MEEVVKKLIKSPKLARKQKLQSMLDRVSQEMYLRNKELADTNKTLTLLGTIDALVLESQANLRTVCMHVAEAITQVTDFSFVGLMTRSTNSKRDLLLNGWSTTSGVGNESMADLGFSKPVRLSLGSPLFSEPEGFKLIDFETTSNQEVAAALNLPTEDIKRFKHRLPLKSLYIAKLTARQRIVGLLIIGYNYPVKTMTPADTLLVERLSEGLGVALDNKLLFEENQHVLRQLKESNAKLRALDEAKDDFISMASHQLRTPLTSVKGYISMIKEGDAGKVTPLQKQMLNQAFFSSQRMVYLIADLLNVSRLRTGKFIIEATPVNLAQVIDEEIGQLTEIARIHKQALVYDVPKKFPELMLDEVKTRQVIMNMIDNALHYTPTGGIITVKLIEKPLTVEMRVEDNGIGVPKSEQPHLFTKFYRAGNARKTRPDGTGLGLFMAKKVIIAQGGSVIFETHENKGSTFGFVFSKAKHATPPLSDKPSKTASKS
ncbi:MAG: HAMP domain-containing sensor histidine kinase [Patescibacteria group bacterium]